MAIDIQTLLSGLSEGEARKKVELQDIERSKALASRPGHAGFMSLLMGGGRGIAEAMGYVDPEIDKAIKMEVFKKKVSERATSMGVDQAKDPEKFLDVVIGSAIEDGRIDVAQTALEAKRKAELERRKVEDMETDTKNKKAYDDQYLKLMDEKNQLMAELRALREANAGKPKAPLRATKDDKNTALSQLKARPDWITGLGEEELGALSSALATRMNERRNILKEEFDYEVEFEEALDQLKASGQLAPGKVKTMFGFDFLLKDDKAKYTPGIKTKGAIGSTDTSDRVTVYQNGKPVGTVPNTPEQIELAKSKGLTIK